jgi:competence protein ComEC
MIPNYKGEIPIVVLFIPFLLGIVCGLNFLSFANISLLVILLISLGGVFVLLNLFYLKLNIYKVSWLGGVLITVMLFLFGLIATINHNELNRDNYFAKTPAKYVLVKISNEPVLKNGLIRFKANVVESIDSDKTLPVTGTLLITIKDSLAKSLYYGDELVIPANYSAIDPPFNPAEFNYKQYLANQNIYQQSFLYHGQYAVAAYDTGHAFMAFSLRLRRQLVAKLKLNMHDPAASAVASTLILGYKADMSSDVLQAYSKTGTMYVLSVSGAQVAIIYLLLNFVFGFLDRFKYGRILKALIIVVLISYYALLTGLSPAVCRAAVMVGMVVIGKAFNRYINTLNILAISAFVLLLYNPFWLADVGFQISYLAVGGLIIFQPAVYKWFSFKNKLTSKLWAVCSVSIAAQLIIFPVSAFYFHQFPVYFLLSNLVVIIPASIIMYTGIIYLLLPQVPVISPVLGWVLEKTILVMNKVLFVIENAPFASVSKIWINTGEYILLYAIIISLLYFFYDRKKWLLLLSLMCIFLLSAGISYKKIHSLQANSIAFLNMRKHMGIVMKHGDKAVVFSDLSDTDKNYKYSIQPYLDSSQITTISLYKPEQDIKSAFLLKKGNFIRFLNTSVYILDKNSLNSYPDSRLKTNFIYLTGNPYTALNSINKNFAYQMLVIDAGNSDYNIKRLIKEATVSHTNYQVLKRNKALLAVSN